MLQYCNRIYKMIKHEGVSVSGIAAAYEEAKLFEALGSCRLEELHQYHFQEMSSQPDPRNLGHHAFHQVGYSASSGPSNSPTCLEMANFQDAMAYDNPR